jgi:hypothetical protein
LHQEQFGASLVLPILVVTSGGALYTKRLFFKALLFAVLVCSPDSSRAQGASVGNDLDKVYKDESHCLVAPEIRGEADNPLSCWCRDALVDARYVYQGYLITRKDRNLNGAYLALEGTASRMCGDNYDTIHNATHEKGWRWNGPEVVRQYRPDAEIERLTPDSHGWRTVAYKVMLIYRDPQGNVTKVENFSASERFPPDYFTHPETRKPITAK